ncbi:hypothetical protein [Streptomyces sp. BK239]|uniref:hypothetical protein n=1 Tax=Streptomyces sp. BK239 TaxID=2512155 RepID=UPI00102B7BA4|nr:hypothetical protein [Streptomyces sp. BK239]
MSSTSCGLLPEHPEGPVVGARAEGDSIVVKFPVCRGDDMRRVEVRDSDDVKSEEPRLVWWASDPVTPSAEQGVVRLWSGEGFTRHAAPPAGSSVPRNVEVKYADATGVGYSEVLTLATVAKAQLEAGHYWTRDGAKTEAQIDAQLPCGGQSTTPGG